MPDETGPKPCARAAPQPASPSPASSGTSSVGNGHAGTGQSGGSAHATQASFLTLAIGAIGVVYGDIGTSPLYALRRSVAAATGAHDGVVTSVSRDIVLGLLSLILWSLILVVTLKYVVILLKADNNGEGAR